MTQFNKLLLILLTVLILPVSCSDDKDPVIDGEKTLLEISENRLTFERIGETKSVTITTNAKVVTSKVFPEGWCTATIVGDKMNIMAVMNPDAASRGTVVTIEADGLKRTITVSQSGRNSAISDVKDDIKISVKSGVASSFQLTDKVDERIEKSFDGNMSTIYHSAWNNAGDNYFPITLTYNFENVSAMDYLVYYPRIEGSNGFFKEFELWVAAEGKPLAKYGDYDFMGSSSSSRINFAPALINPTQIQFVVKSGAGDGQGFASCAEMEFYRKNPDNFDYLTIFTDHTCSQLKDGIDEAQIKSIGNQFFRDLAFEILKDEYDSEFRVQTYKAWQHPDVMSKINKTGSYGLRDNPTGIYINQGEELIVMVGDTYGQNISLFVQDTNNRMAGSSFSLYTGLNKIKAPKSGLTYIMYYTQTGTEKPVKINIAAGTVNGYFDSQKHKKEDWSRILSKATYRHFDLIGKYAVMTFETAAYKNYVADGLALINKYDDLVRLQQDFLGLFDNGKAFKNRAYFLAVYDSFMYAGSYHTGYNADTQATILNLQEISTSGACWGPAHEMGHIHQTRPGMKWHGMTEVTNNILALHVQTSWGIQSRLEFEDFYGEASTNLLKKGIPYSNYKGPGTVFSQLVPFWQLKLYMIDVLGKKSFYKDIFEKVRTTPNVDTSVITDGYYQLNFVRMACESSELDLTDFFDAWGFFIPVDIPELDDYGKRRFTITQEQVNELKAEIAAKKYPKPKHNIYDIRDSNLSNFK